MTVSYERRSHQYAKYSRICCLSLICVKQANAVPLIRSLFFSFLFVSFASTAKPAGTCSGYAGCVSPQVLMSNPSSKTCAAATCTTVECCVARMHFYICDSLCFGHARWAAKQTTSKVHRTLRTPAIPLCPIVKICSNCRLTLWVLTDVYALLKKRAVETAFLKCYKTIFFIC